MIKKNHNNKRLKKKSASKEIITISENQRLNKESASNKKHKHMKNTFWYITVLFSFLALCTVAQSEIKICKDSLPVEVINLLNNKYPDYKISISLKCTNKSNEITYKIKTTKIISPQKNIIYDLSFNELGKLIDKKKSKEIFYTGYDHTKPSSSNFNNNSGGHEH